MTGIAARDRHKGPGDFLRQPLRAFEGPIDDAHLEKPCIREAVGNRPGSATGAQHDGGPVHRQRPVDPCPEGFHEPVAIRAVALDSTIGAEHQSVHRTDPVGRSGSLVRKCKRLLLVGNGYVAALEPRCLEPANAGFKLSGRRCMASIFAFDAVPLEPVPEYLRRTGMPDRPADHAGPSGLRIHGYHPSLLQLQHAEFPELPEQRQERQTENGEVIARDRIK